MTEPIFQADFNTIEDGRIPVLLLNDVAKRLRAGDRVIVRDLDGGLERQAVVEEVREQYAMLRLDSRPPEHYA